MLRVSLGPLADLSYPGLPLGTVWLRLYAAPAYLETRGMPLLPEDVTAQALILAGPLRAAARLTLIGTDGPHAIPVRPSILASDFTSALRFAEAGGGVAPLPQPIAADAVTAGRLVPVLPDWHLGDARLYALTQDGRDGPARVRALVAFLKEALALDAGRIA